MPSRAGRLCVFSALVWLAPGSGSGALAQPLHHPMSVTPGTAPPPAGKEMPIWRANLATKFEELAIEDAVAKAKAEYKLVVVFHHSGPDPWAGKMSDAFRNPTLASYLAWRCVTIHVGTAHAAPDAQPGSATEWVEVLLPVGNGYRVLEIIRTPSFSIAGEAPAFGGIPLSTFGGILEVLPTATNVLFQVDFTRERLCARDPMWGMESDRFNPMPDGPPPEDPMHQVEDDTALAIADPGPDDRGWRTDPPPPPLGAVPLSDDPPAPTFNHAPYDVIDRLELARAAVSDRDPRLATGLYTWVWERSESLDPASRAFRRTVLPLELERLGTKNDLVRERFGKVRDQLSRRVLYIGFGDLMLWLTLNEICGEPAENVMYLDLYTNDRDEATMMPRTHYAAYRLIGAREKFIDPWRIDAPARSVRGGSSPAMPRDPDGAALAHLNAVIRRLAEAPHPTMTDEDFAALQTFRREYLIDEAARLHVALLRTGRDSVARQAIDVTLEALPVDADRAQLLNSAVFCALATGNARADMHAGYLADAAKLGYENLTLGLRLQESGARPATPAAAPTPVTPTTTTPAPNLRPGRVTP